MEGSHFAIFKLVMLRLKLYHCFTEKKDKVKAHKKKLLVVTKIVLTLRLESSILRMIVWLFGSAPSIRYSSRNYISHALEVLDLHLLVQQYTHSGHRIKLVRSSTYHFLNKLLQLKSSREDLVLFLVTCKT